ncbi:MAG: hypothetical protein RL318_1261 [Fibrobacterota bacterium]|jgi:hypothetical protein
MSDTLTNEPRRQPLDAQTRRMIAMNGPMRLFDDGFGSGGGQCSPSDCGSCGTSCLPDMVQSLPQRPWTIQAFGASA